MQWILYIAAGIGLVALVVVAFHLLMLPFFLNRMLAHLKAIRKTQERILRCGIGEANVVKNELQKNGH